MSRAPLPVRQSTVPGATTQHVVKGDLVAGLRAPPAVAFAGIGAGDGKVPAGDAQRAAVLAVAPAALLHPVLRLDHSQKFQTQPLPILLFSRPQSSLHFRSEEQRICTDVEVSKLHLQ